MKIRRLPEIDLARIAVLDESEQRVRLRQLRFGRPPHSYRPSRLCFPDLLNEQSDLLGPAPTTEWEQIDKRLRSESNHDTEYEFNRAVAKALHDFAKARGVKSRRRPVPSWSIGFEQSVAYWLPVYSVWDDRASFPFLDPRLSRGLNRDARRFAFSVMHERIRVPHPDLAEARLVILQFAKGEKGSRIVQLHDSDGIELFSMDQLNEMVSTTWRLWLEVLAEREAQQRSTGTDDFGPLFGSSA